MGDYGSLREQWLFEENPKIVIKLFGTRIQAAIDHFKYYSNNSLILLVRNPKKEMYLFNPDNYFSSREEEFYYLLGVLNSSLISQYYRTLFKHTHVRGNYLQYYIKDLGEIPLMVPSEENINIMKKIAQLAEQLTDLFKDYAKNLKLITDLEKILDDLVKNLYIFEES